MACCNRLAIMLLNLILLVSLEPSLANEDTLPVFMIDQDQALSHISMDSNPFIKTSSPKFADIIYESMKRCEGVIIFVEENFSVQDIGLKDRKGSPYVHLGEIVKEKKAKYFPAVTEPYRLLTQIFPPQHSNVFYSKSPNTLQLTHSFKYIYVHFQDGYNETRMDALRRHDTIIHEVCFMFRQIKRGPIIAIYTGKSNPVVVRKVHFVPIKPMPIPKDLGVMIVSSGALFRFAGVYAATATRRAVFNQLPEISDESWTPHSLSTRMAYTDFDLEFNFTFREDGWILDSVGLLEAGEEVGRTMMGVGAPWNMSYVCGEPLLIVNTRDGSLVSISQYQIQPRISDYRREADDSDAPDTTPETTTETSTPQTTSQTTTTAKPDGILEFGKSRNCGPYFNIPILSSLFVTIILLFILSFGIVFMMNINTNSRYEDPMSKPMVHAET